MKKLKKRKPKTRSKQYKGCLKMPLNTNMALADFAKMCTYTGQWLTERQHILSERACRQWYINVYITKTDGQKYIETITSPTLLNKYQLNGLIDEALKSAQTTQDIDYDLSYLTVSC